MKIKTAVWIAESCIRHVLKELRGEYNYKYTKEPRKESLQTRIEQFEEAIKVLNDLYKDMEIHFGEEK